MNTSNSHGGAWMKLSWSWSHKLFSISQGLLPWWYIFSTVYTNESHKHICHITSIIAWNEELLRPLWFIGKQSVKHKRVGLTGAVGCSARPGAVSLALPCGGAAQQVAVHTRIDDRVWKGGAVESVNPSVTGSPRVTTLHRYSMSETQIYEELWRDVHTYRPTLLSYYLLFTVLWPFTLF